MGVCSINLCPYIAVVVVLLVEVLFVVDVTDVVCNVNSYINSIEMI